jgi:hypothetical protein
MVTALMYLSDVKAGGETQGVRDRGLRAHLNTLGFFLPPSMHRGFHGVF